MSARLNLGLMALLIACALAAITSQHRARKLTTDLEAERESAQRLDREWRELQLEQQTLATQQRIEDKARRELGMRPVEPGRAVVVVVGAAAAPKAGAQ